MSRSNYANLCADESLADLNCVICREAFQSPVRLRQCSHQFCRDCLERWLNQSSTCPICRRIVSSNSWSADFCDWLRPLIKELQSIRRQQVQLRSSVDQLEEQLDGILQWCHDFERKH